MQSPGFTKLPLSPEFSPLLWTGLKNFDGHDFDFLANFFFFSTKSYGSDRREWIYRFSFRRDWLEPVFGYFMRAAQRLNGSMMSDSGCHDVFIMEAISTNTIRSLLGPPVFWWESPPPLRTSFEESHKQSENLKAPQMRCGSRVSDSDGQWNGTVVVGEHVTICWNRPQRHEGIRGSDSECHGIVIMRTLCPSCRVLGQKSWVDLLDTPTALSHSALPLCRKISWTMGDIPSGK